MKSIGLFPLSIVLFPGSSYPLHIFEPRYRTLIRECIEGNGEFGVNLVESGHLFQVGCTARVASVLKEYEDGKLDIVVSGNERYRIEKTDDTSRPYIVGEIEPFADTDPKPDPRLLDETIRLYNDLVEAVYGEAEEQLKSTEWMWGGGSFRIAQKSGLDLALRQSLLEMTSENKRLEFLNSYLTELVPKIKSFERVQMIIRNDGYSK